MSAITFSKELEITFELDVEGTKEKVLAGNITKIELAAHSYGYAAEVEFLTFDNDKLDALFIKEKVMKATLAFLEKGSPILEVKGIVSQRGYTPQGKGNDKKPVRIYAVCFTDAATITWSHHFPMKIFVDQTMKDVIEAEKNPLISIKYDWDELTKPSPILAYNLEHKNRLTPVEQTSFYAFLNWYLYQFNGILEYDYKENSYSVLGKKSEKGKPVPLPEWFMTPPKCHYPEPTRFQKRQIKHSAKNMDQSDGENPNSFQSVRKDEFDESTYTHFPEQVSQIVKSASSREMQTLTFYLKNFSEAMNLGNLVPGALFEIKEDVKTGGVWCEDPAFKGKTFRVTDFTFKAVMEGGAEAVDRPIQSYKIDVQVDAESKDDTFVQRPSFPRPTFPFSIPGKIFSEIGPPEQTTFNLVKSDKIPLGHYQVTIPLAGDKKIVVPFYPDTLNGQHYFPLCKDQQIMLAVYFQTARIERILDWQPLARLPLDTQANQIVFGSNGQDKYTIQKHEFKGGQEAVLTIIQSTSKNQTQTIQVEDKDLTITVEEKGKNTVTIKLNRQNGLLLQMKDTDSGVTQQSQYNSESITHTSQGSDGKTTVIQKPDSISMECKTFTLASDEVVIDAKKTATLKAASKIFIDAPVVNAKETVNMGS